MSTPAFKAKAYLRDGCPFSFKYWLFMAESGLGRQIEVIRCDPRDAAAFARVKATLGQALGGDVTFPIVEVEPGHYETDSDALIERYARQNGVDVASLPALTFYKQTILPQVVELHEMKGEV